MSALKLVAGTAIAVAIAFPAWSQEARVPTREDPPEAAADPAQTDWREEYAYTLGLQAYIYAFPLTYMTELRHDWITNPDMGDRYFSFEMADYFSDNFAYVGKRTTGSEAGSFAIVPRRWNGELPTEVKQSFESPTTFALIFGRTLVSGEADVEAVNALQEQYRLTPLAYWDRAEQAPEKRNVFAPFPVGEDGLGAWRTINRAWAENPLPKDRDPDLVQLFSEIGVGPSFSAESVDDLPEPTKRGLARAAKAGRPMIEEMMSTGAFKSKVVNGWSYPPKSFGRAGLASDFVTRAVQSLGGIIANDPEEAVYLNTFHDSRGEPLVGGRRYTIEFDNDSVPPTNEFYSMTLYGPDTNFFPNDIKRYSIGDRTPDLVRDPDGSLVVYIQPEEPTDPKQRANWLPSPKDGTFYLVLRTYGPREPIIDQTYAPPAVVPSL